MVFVRLMGLTCSSVSHPHQLACLRHIAAECKFGVLRELKEAGMAKAKSPIPEGYHSITPQLTLDNAAQSIDWYKKALDAQEVSRFAGPDGKIMHAELRIGNSRFMVNDVMMGKGPKAYGGSPASFWIYVNDCDALFNRALAAGAKTLEGPMGALQDQFWGDRSGSLKDPEGYVWTIATRKEDLTPEEMKRRGEEWMKKFASQAAHR
jgi:PhnB protein